MAETDIRERRWRLAVGGEDDQLPTSDQRPSQALTMLYGGEDDGPGKHGKRR